MISLFFLHSVPELQRLSLGWTALLGAIFLIILADIEDMEAILARVEWSTLLFFAALFILMEALSELGLIEWIGSMTENIILGVSEESRLMVAVLIILWVSPFFIYLYKINQTRGKPSEVVDFVSSLQMKREA